MCCFSQPVETVADTNIFARAARSGGQYLVYSMKFSAAEDLAMILPIPTPRNSAEDAVKFISLEKYESFFDDMKKGFPEPPAPRGAGIKKDDTPKPAALPVVEVGSFVASFVPAIKDFARLDKQFRLPDGVWEKLPQYKGYGFAVFKLKKPAKKDGTQKVHPMAFEFPRADTELLFFPTVHIHDGSVPAKAKFDHALFCQGAAPLGWDESPGHPVSFMKVKETQGIVDANAHVYRKLMKGMFANKDVGL
jgi:hypothetical protein